MARPPSVRVLPALATALGLAALTVFLPPRAAACSGAPGVLAADLEASVGRIVVAKVVERNGRAPGPRGVTLAVQETLRGAGPDLITVDRPRQATGVCHDVFTVWRNARVLVAFDVFPLAGGGPLMPAWTVRKDGSLGAIYDDPPWETLDQARSALVSTPQRASAEVEGGVGQIAVTLLAGIGVLLAALVAGTRVRPSPVPVAADVRPGGPRRRSPRG